VTYAAGFKVLMPLQAQAVDCECDANACAAVCGKTQLCGGTQAIDDACGQCWTGSAEAKCNAPVDAACSKDPDCVQAQKCIDECP
jgi:hypothetical protein